MIEIAYYIAGKAKQILGGTLSVNQYKKFGVIFKQPSIYQTISTHSSTPS